MKNPNDQVISALSQYLIDFKRTRDTLKSVYLTDSEVRQLRQLEIELIDGLIEIKRQRQAK